MAESINSFVKQLKQEGVEAGRSEADKIIADARQEADRIVAEAKRQAEQIVDDGKQEARQALEQARNELEMASRDAMLKLRDQIATTLNQVLRQATAEALDDPQFLTRCIHDVVTQYAEKDSSNIWPIDIRVSPQMCETVTDWALREMVAEGDSLRGKINLHSQLKDAGFEYSISAGTVDMTAGSVAEVLSELVSPRLKEVIGQADVTEA